jgi:N-acetylglucosaminyl-diphospho-decaprenol L-rhamnosyltransferase
MRGGRWFTSGSDATLVTAADKETAAVEVSAVVVNYNAGQFLVDCVAGLRNEGIGEVVVVDNHSTDGSLAALAEADPDVFRLASGGNLGYGRAANLGAARCHGRYLLVCNPDVVIRPGAVATLAKALDADPGLGIVGPRLVNPDGSLYPSARAFPSLGDAVGHGALGLIWPSNPWSRRYRLLDWDHIEGRRVDWVSGALFLVRMETWQALGGFDPSYYMYLEDVDLCWRAGHSGWEVGYDPAAEVLHIQGVSANQRPYRMIVAHHRSMWRFARRSTLGWRRLLLPVIGAGLLGRALVASAMRWSAGCPRRSHPDRMR